MLQCPCAQLPRSDSAVLAACTRDVNFHMLQESAEGGAQACVQWLDAHGAALAGATPGLRLRQSRLKCRPATDADVLGLKHMSCARCTMYVTLQSSSNLPEPSLRRRRKAVSVKHRI